VVPDVAWHDKHIKGGYQKGMPVNLAIGQGDVNVTPMQQLVFYSALATGILWKPQIVTRIEDADGTVLKEFGPVERGRPAIQKSTRDTVLKGLLAAVNQPFGTAYSHRSTDFISAGKTGTAQVVKLGKRLKAEAVPYFERDHAWFAAFAPVEDPEIVVVVLNEHSGFGATNAAPTAMALVKKYMELKAQDAAERAGGAAVAQAEGAAPAAAPAGAAPGATPSPVALPAAVIPAIVPVPVATPGAKAPPAAPPAARDPGAPQDRALPPAGPAAPKPPAKAPPAKAPAAAPMPRDDRPKLGAGDGGARRGA